VEAAPLSSHYLLLQNLRANNVMNTVVQGSIHPIFRDHFVSTAKL
jgi:hypothetical protein